MAETAEWADNGRAMATPRHIAIFLPQETPFYRALLAQMRRGFEGEGVETSGLCRLLGEAEMAGYVAAQRPDVIFEMNRPRCEARFIPRAVKHVCWVVDFGGRSLAQFEGSEITYLFGLTWPAQYPHAGFHRWFGPGACEVDYDAAPLEVMDPRFAADVAFAGHMPRPWTEAELGREIARGLSFGAVLPELEARLRALRGRLVSADDFVQVAQAIATERGAGPLTLDPRLRYDVTGRVIRHLNRGDLVDAALGATSSLALYGSENWRAWPRYAPHYRGFLAEPAALRAVYQGARITLHEGNGMHFRALDCMSAGGLLFFRSTAHDLAPGGIASFFSPHVHYVPFDLDNLAAEIATYLADEPRARQIRRDAAAAIRAGHTWRHRAREVLRDLRDV